MRKLAIVLVAVLAIGCGSESGGDNNANNWEFCDGEPVCPQGYQQLPEDSPCPEQSCTEVTECGDTIQCEAPIDCDAAPVCPEGTGLVSSDDDCESDDECFSVTVCSTTIHCSPSVCDESGPECPEGSELVDEPAQECTGDAECFEVTDPECNQIVWCTEEPVCECPDGDPDCLDDPDSGRIYFEQCPVDSCDGPPEMCDPCFEHGDYFYGDCGCGCEPRPEKHCAVSDLEAQGACEMIIAYGFDGDQCVSVSGCECEGEDCDRFDSLEECQRTTGDCDGSCGDPDGPICTGAYPAPDYPQSPEDCPVDTRFTVDDCEPRCIELDSCELAE